MVENSNGNDTREPRHLNILARVPARLRRPARIATGLLLIAGGILGFLPILGFWMVPLGLSILAVDYPPAGRMLHKLRDAFRKLRS